MQIVKFFDRPRLLLEIFFSVHLFRSLVYVSVFDSEIRRP